jgi:CpeT protein
MKRIYLFIIIILIPILNQGCKTSSVYVNKQGLKTLINFMEGDFNSTEQSKNDTSYFDIRLHVHQVVTKNNEYWLYVEQAVSTAQDKPYRQRIYKVKQLDNTNYTSEIYTITNEKDWIGIHNDPLKMKKMPLSIDQKKGCTVYIRLLEDGTYKGATNEKDCESKLRGATYATTEVSITPQMMVSWDRGYDTNGKQMWGAVKGGYKFIKASN